LTRAFKYLKDQRLTIHSGISTRRSNDRAESSKRPVVFPILFIPLRRFIRPQTAWLLADNGLQPGSPTTVRIMKDNCVVPSR
jgi:hypothetical protein